MNYTEEDIRNAFKSGLIKGNHQSYFDAPLNEDEYVEKLKQVKNNFVLADVSGSLQARLFELANDFAVAKQGEIAVKLHSIYNGLQ